MIYDRGRIDIDCTALVKRLAGSMSEQCSSAFSANDKSCFAQAIADLVEHWIGKSIRGYRAQQSRESLPEDSARHAPESDDECRQTEPSAPQ